MGVSSPPATTTDSSTAPARSSTLAALPHLAVVLTALAGIIVLAALHVVSGDVAAGTIGAAIGGSGAVAAANLTPNG